MSDLSDLSDPNEWGLDSLPPRRKVGDEIRRKIEALKKSPGWWILYGQEMHPSNAAKLRKRFPGIEVATRNQTFDGERFVCDVYVRWPRGEGEGEGEADGGGEGPLPGEGIAETR